jgi:pimeloyl-ACP methyl ester carboxylesterase
MQATPFTISIDESVLNDLRERLARTRWPDDALDGSWEFGADLAFMKRLAKHWQTQYDWRIHERRLNEQAQFTTTVDGTSLHFVHVRGKGRRVTPLLLVHGWPDSFYRFHKVIPLLTDPAAHGLDADDAFDVVVPSIPGFGFSDRTALPTDVVADRFAALMKGLGYERFMAAGGDAGSLIVMSLSRRHAERVQGIHLTDVGYPDGSTDFSALSQPELEFAGFIQGWWTREGAFNMVQATKPQSVAFALTDSPVGMAAWMMSMMSSGASDKLDQRFTLDELLTNFTIYWVTGTIGSSMRFYLENARASRPDGAARVRSQVPAAVAHMPWDAPLPPAWAERHVSVRQFTEMPRGGHFSAWEAPEAYASDVRTFIATLRNDGQTGL